MYFSRYSGESEGATATVAATRPHNDQRQLRKITVENFANQLNDGDGTAPKSLLPSFGSRETTPMATVATADDAKAIEEKGFIYGNPFVEVTKGIIHIYKKK